MKQVDGKYKGWNVRALENELIKLRVAPDLGGRIIQLEMDDYGYLFNNPLMVGKSPDENRLGENGSWLNFGGEKIWPAPQGWNSPEQWPGPPDPVLDSGIYTVSHEHSSENGNCLTVTSPVDSRTGLQITKKVSLEKNRSVTVVTASFCNKTTFSVRWSIWSVMQVNIQEDINDRYRIICPVNPKSEFNEGIKVMHGLVNNPQYKKDASGNLVVSYKYLVGKIGLDSDAGWITFLDLKTGKVAALTFNYEEKGLYPEGTSVQIWTQGRGIIFSRNKIVEYKNNKKLNPPYMEMEILSPLKEIKPGRSIHFKYRILCATIIPFNESISNVNEIGIVASPLRLESKDDNIILCAQYGVFNEGKIRIIMQNQSLENKNEDLNILYEKEVTPFEGIDIKITIKSKWLNKYTSLLVLIYDLDDRCLGKIEQVKI